MELELVAQVDTENPDENDLRLVAGDLSWTSDLATEVAQRLRVRLRFFKGEWFLDTRQGTPWYQEILGHKGLDPRVIRGLFTRIVQATEGVAGVDALEYRTDNTTREMVLEFTARLVDGSQLRSTEFPPFIVRV